jgi:hypothetical protein
MEDVDIDNYLLDRTEIAQEIRARINTGDYVELKNFNMSKETITRMNK